MTAYKITKALKILEGVDASGLGYNDAENFRGALTRLRSVRRGFSHQ